MPTATIGSTGTHATPAAWETATNIDLSGLGEHIGALQDETHSSTVDINGATNESSTDFRHLSVDTGAEYDLVAATGAVMTSSGSGRTIEVTDQWTRVSMFRSDYNGSSSRNGIRFRTGGDCFAHAMVSVCDGGSGTATCFLRGSGTGSHFIACIAIGSGGVASTGATTGFAGAVDVINCISYDIDRGSGVGVGNSADQIRRNNISMNSGSADYSGTPASDDYNMASDTTANGANSIDSATDTTVFNDPVNWDFRILSGNADGGDGDGNDETGTVAEWDETGIDGVSFSTWHMGAYGALFSAGGPPSMDSWFVPINDPVIPPNEVVGY